MKKLVLVIVAMQALFFAACPFDDDDIPIPLPPPPPGSEEPAKISEPEKTANEIPVDLPPEPQAQTPPPPSPLPPPLPPSPSPSQSPPPPPLPAHAQEPPKPKKSESFNNYSFSGEQLDKGRYTIQVAVFPSESRANSLVNKLRDNGINAYVARVNNPAQLLGIYYRVRIGYFDTKQAAASFAKSRLCQLGYDWWVDLSRNDKIGTQGISQPAAEIKKQQVKKAVKKKVRVKAQSRRGQKPAEEDDEDEYEEDDEEEEE